MSRIKCVLFGLHDTNPVVFTVNSEFEVFQHANEQGIRLDSSWPVSSHTRIFFNFDDNGDETKPNPLLLTHTPVLANRFYGTVVLALLPKPESDVILEQTISDLVDSASLQTPEKPIDSELEEFMSRFEFAENKDASFSVPLGNLRGDVAIDIAKSKGYNAHVAFSHGINQERTLFVSKA